MRENCGIFDISHMGEFLIRGREAVLVGFDAHEFRGQTRGRAGTVFAAAEQHGGIIDDLIFYRTGAQEFLLIVNAAKIDEDFTWLRDHISNGADEVALRISAMPTRPWPSKDRGHRRFSRKHFLFSLGAAQKSHREFGDEPAAA